MKKIFATVCIIVVVVGALWYVRSTRAVLQEFVTPPQSGPGPLPPPPSLDEMPGSSAGTGPPPPMSGRMPVPPTEGAMPGPMHSSQNVFRDGTYSAEGSYTSPGGGEVVGISLTLKDGVITNAAGEVLATRPASMRFQKEFVDGFALQVVGKKITDVTLQKVSGSSLTPRGFNDAVAKIEAEAEA